MKERHTQIRPKDAMKVVLILAIATALIVAAILIPRMINRIQASQAMTLLETVIPQTETLAVTDPEYAPKEKISSYLFMGIDRDGPAKSNHSYIDGGQADVQFLLVVDEEAQTWQLLHINRDSIVDVPILGIAGHAIRTERQQIALAHAYGDGTTDSCRNAQKAVSNMLGGQEIDGYLALNMGGISILNDFVGGVTVTIESDFSEVDSSLVMGQTIKLNGEQAYNFIRSRKNVDDQTNLSRMKRHRQFLEGLSQKLTDMSDEDIIKGYDAMFDYIVTDIGSKTMTKLVDKLQAYTQLDTLTIAGTSYLDEEGCNAYCLDEKSLEQAILTLFYNRNQT